MEALLPPGPHGKLRPTIGYARNPVQYFCSMADRYGDPFLMKTMFGTWFVTGRPDAIQTIFSANPAIYDSFIGDTLEAISGANSLPVLQGERHRAERKLLMPFFHGERMRLQANRIRDVALRHATAWRPGAAFALHDTTLKISLDVITELVFGVHDSERIVQFRHALLARDKATTPTVVFFKPLRRELGGFGPWAKFRRAADHLDRLFYEAIDERRRAPDESRDDILNQLLAARYEDGSPMSDRAIIDELITVAIAAHETTAITMAWAIYHLCRHPEVRARALADIAALGPNPEPDALARLPYLDAICRETLRVSHPATDVMRRLNQPLEVLDYRLPAGMGINVCVPLVHRRPELYPEPQRFRPERFLERSYSASEYVAFGGGHRRCLGASFAMYEMKVVLGTLLPRYPLRLAEDRELAAVRWSVFMAPEGGVPVVLDA